jgi:hypothetical protein
MTECTKRLSAAIRLFRAFARALDLFRISGFLLRAFACREPDSLQPVK